MQLDIKSNNPQVITCQVFENIASCKDLLRPLQVPTLFLNADYLQCVEEAFAGDMQFRYLFFFDREQVIGFSYCQIHPFMAEESLKSFRSQQESGAIGARLRSVLAKLVRFKALVCGNLLLTGEYSCYFLPEYRQYKFSLLENAWDQLFRKLQILDEDISVMFIKEFESKVEERVRSVFSNHDYYLFSVQPSMILEGVARWNSFDDYLVALKSKYRIRIRAALKRRRELIAKEMTLQDLKNETSAFQFLLQQVLDESEFRIVNLNVHYLILLKERFPDSFQLIGYYHKGALVGFMSYFIDQKNLVAHLTGFDLKKNKSLDLYLNLLIDLVSKSISTGSDVLILSRTALEIKSSIGAVPVPMINMLRHRKKSLNLALPHVYQLLYTNEPWNQRHPFRNDKPLPR